ncbi:uncharacterized protein LOC130386969 isoform X3 [Gadus chalcogrammus]|uniref:uncharacterized protein LOC130386969 isoform X3 n=1 Tax=Gadus chalcogrammus TaxID=1042646 RepID=UPI0024C4904D|nr:uncharacterized protein LOC130386969 isoform X3 [Gadus chalcogrammus]
MVNILVAHMIDNHGHLPTKETREDYAHGIVMLFPSLRDPYSKKGYEHFYDSASSTGYISWRLKTVQRKIRQGSAVPPNSAICFSPGGPNFQRTVHVERQLDGDACQKAMSLLNHTPDNSLIFQKIRETFLHRKKLVNDPGRSVDILSSFPRFLDTKGLMDQDFTLLFDDDTSSRLLQKWDLFFKPNVIKEAKQLTSTPELRHLVQSAESPQGDDLDEETTYDQEMASLLLLLHLLPPPPGGLKSPKISASDALERLVVFHKFSYFYPSHAAVWRSISATSRVDSHTSLQSGVRRARLTASTSPWINISSHARQSASSGHAMNFSKHILCLICLTMWH